jgi:hypothetical protein
MGKPELYTMSFKFSQEANCLSHEDEYEELQIECLADLGIDASDGRFFMVLKTEKWSIDSVAELEELVERIKRVMNKTEIKDGK